MEKILDVAQYICDEYKRISGEPIDEMKLHKLLYYSQRENLAINNEPLFEESFEGWVHGPVSTIVRNNFYKSRLICITEKISYAAMYVIRNIIEQYGSITSWKLSEMTHNEISWINSRKGLSQSQNGNVAIKLDDIRKDAEKVRPYDSIWDMYYDEFDDIDEAKLCV